MGKVRAALALMTALLPVCAEARIRQPAQVRYDTSEGQSEWYKVDVIFITGSELNSATNSIRYSMFKNYAVIFWAKDEASVIRLDEPTLIGCGMTFESSCLPLFGKMKGPDQQGRTWEVCTATFCV